MKTRLLGTAIALLLSFGSAKGVTLATTFIANTSNNVGLITTTQSGSLANVTGTLWIYSSSTNLTSIASTVDTRAEFEALLTLDPGAVRSNVAFTNGAVTSSSPGPSNTTEVGAAGNRIYVWIQSTDGTSYGAFKQTAVVPSVGSIVMNSASMSDLGVGTSVYSATGTSGFQLAFAPIPEPSAALLGMLGALGLLRRRR